MNRRDLLGLRMARVTATRDDAPVRVSQVQMSSLETQDGAAVVQHYGIASHPLPGCDAVIAMHGGERAPRAVVIATHDQRYHIRLAPGEVAIHTDEGDHVMLRRGRIVEIVAGAQVHIIAPSVLVTGDLVVSGNISDQNGGHGTMAALRTAYDAHRHPGVVSGGGTTGTTDHVVP